MSTTGVILCYGVMIDEPVDEYIVSKTSCSKGRTLLVLMWIMFGSFLAIAYKSVLLENMIAIDYESGIDSVDDMLGSGKPLVLDGSSAMLGLLKQDPRPKYKELSKRVVTYKMDGNKKEMAPMWVING